MDKKLEHQQHQHNFDVADILWETVILTTRKYFYRRGIMTLLPNKIHQQTVCGNLQWFKQLPSTLNTHFSDSFRKIIIFTITTGQQKIVKQIHLIGLSILFESIRCHICLLVRICFLSAPNYGIPEINFNQKVFFSFSGFSIGFDQFSRSR
jgi:hypothetical protein